MCCDFKSERECSCEPNECRVSDPIRITKAHPAPASTAPYQYAAVFLFAAVAIWWGACEGASQQKTINRDRQEIVAWTR